MKRSVRIQSECRFIGFAKTDGALVAYRFIDLVTAFCTTLIESKHRCFELKKVA